MDWSYSLRFVHHRHNLHSLWSTFFVRGFPPKYTCSSMCYRLLRGMETVEETGIHSTLTSRFDQWTKGNGPESREGERSRRTSNLGSNQKVCFQLEIPV